MLLQAVGLAWFAELAAGHAGYAGMVPALVVAGIGISMALPTAAAAAMSAVAPGELGKASGTNSTLQRLGGVLGVAVVTAVVTAHGRFGGAVGVADGFRHALLVAAALSLLGAVTALALDTHPARGLTPAGAPVDELVGAVRS